MITTNMMLSGRFSLLSVITSAFFLGSQALPTSNLQSRQSISVLSSGQIAPFKPYAFYAGAASCDPDLTLNWTCGAKCDANPTFKPVASGGDGGVVQHCTHLNLFISPLSHLTLSVGYVGYDPTLKTVVVSHQGTDATKV